MDTDFHKIYVLNKPDLPINSDRSVNIGEHTWIGCRCTILKGADIPSESVIGANSVVSKRLEKNNAVYVGGEVIREGVSWRV